MLKLLVVDDSNIIRRKIQRACINETFEVVGLAGNGIEALRQFGDLGPEVVTMDITMPHMDGIECVEEMIGRNPNVRILVVSALADKATGIEALEKGARGFLCKPFSDKQLSDALYELSEDIHV
ncbi:MAG: two-component system chemotaxis response regulator CheY [Lentisphaeria bacterium]|jgi:two-component system chemotaxis response regulator CheY